MTHHVNSIARLDGQLSSVMMAGILEGHAKSPNRCIVTLDIHGTLHQWINYPLSKRFLSDCALHLNASLDTTALNHGSLPGFPGNFIRTVCVQPDGQHPMKILTHFHLFPGHLQRFITSSDVNNNIASNTSRRYGERTSAHGYS